MLKRLANLFSSNNPDRTGRTGFVYTPDKEQGPLTAGNAGDIIRLESPPPWIVVDHAKDS